LKLLQTNWKGNAEKVSGFLEIVNNLVSDNGFTQVISGPARGEVFLNIYLLRHES
jgi:hypothetical protein